MREAIEAGEGGAVRRDVRASNFREAEQLVSPVDFMELTPAQIRTFFSSMLYYLNNRPEFAVCGAHLRGEHGGWRRLC